MENVREKLSNMEDRVSGWEDRQIVDENFLELLKDAKP